MICWDITGSHWEDGVRDSPVLSELQRIVSFSARTPGLGPCFIHMVMVNWSVKFLGTMPSGILAPCLPSNLKIISLLSTSSPAVQLVAALGDGKRSMMPEDAPAGAGGQKEQRVVLIRWVSSPSVFCSWVRMNYN